MEKQIFIIQDRVNASQASLFHNIHKCTRRNQGASSFPSALWHPRQQLQVIVLFIVYLIGSMLSVANSAITCLGNSLSLNKFTTLHWNETLVSNDGQFTIGFYHNEMTSSSTGYNLAIWYAKVPIVTPVWMPATSIVVSNKATLSLSKFGGLQLEDNISGYSKFVWAPSSTKLVNITMATILNTGNLVLINNSRHIVWQSFDYPTNTLLPNQHYLLSNKIPMRSWKDERNYTEGQYLLNWKTSNRIELLYKSQNFKGLPYWNYDLSLSTYTKKERLINIEMKNVFLTSKGEFLATIAPNIYSIIGESTVNRSNHLCRITLDVDGNLYMYSWQLGASKSWNKDWEAISNTCKIYGKCGPDAICVDGQCECPKGFKFKDMTDKKIGCEVITIPSLTCNKTSIEDDFVLQLGDYPFANDLFYLSNVTVEHCQQACIKSCECQCATVSFPDVNGYVQCWLKSNLLLNERYRGDKRSYLRMASNSKSNKRKISYSSALLIIFINSPLMIIFGIISCIFGYKSIYKRYKGFQLKKLETKWIVAHGTIMKVSFKEIRLMTNNFAYEVGKGGYGTVYKGEIGCSITTKKVIAVKRLDKFDVQEKEFINEVDIIGRIHHVNLVHLLGYCAEKNHRMLIYEYMEQHSLDKIIFKNEKSKAFILDWRTRFNITIQIAKGLAYLHNDIREQHIIHCDIKPENILLDSMFCAKVADFGMSRFMNREQSFTMTRQIRGTFGYIAPEWTSDEMSITTKIDVYSYGMVLLEIVGGRRNLKKTSTHVNNYNSDWYFPLWAYSKMNLKESMFDVLDPLLYGLANPLEVERVLKIAFWCINDRPHLRPSMSMVVQMLEGHMPIEVPVPQPEFLLDMPTSFINDDKDVDMHEIFTTSIET